MTVAFPEPTTPADSRAGVFTRYLAYFRDRLAVKRRWLEWGFAGRDVAAPWGDSQDGHWYAAPGETLDGLLAALDQQAARSDAVIAAHDLDEVGQPGKRWDGEPPATLERILFHLLQEYDRHLGHLDVVCELAGGGTGE